MKSIGTGSSERVGKSRARKISAEVRVRNKGKGLGKGKEKEKEKMKGKAKTQIMSAEFLSRKRKHAETAMNTLLSNSSSADQAYFAPVMKYFKPPIFETKGKQTPSGLYVVHNRFVSAKFHADNGSTVGGMLKEWASNTAGEPQRRSVGSSVGLVNSSAPKDFVSFPRLYFNEITQTKLQPSVQGPHCPPTKAMLKAHDHATSPRSPKVPTEHLLDEALNRGRKWRKHLVQKYTRRLQHAHPHLRLVGIPRAILQEWGAVPAAVVGNLEVPPGSTTITGGRGTSDGKDSKKKL